MNPTLGSPPQDGSPAVAWLALALLAAALGLVALRMVPPPPLPATAPPEVFSAGRALTELERLDPDESPRPAGTVENARFRARLRAALAELGLDAVETSSFVCGSYGTCATVTNVSATIPGESPDSILLVAHHDTVPAGPGAADDGIGVASLLELGRALRASPPLRHPVVLLFTDGEELGMLGARAFVAAPGQAERVLAAINLEARGVRGPSLVFRATPDAERLLPALRLPRPLASTLQREAFRLLPNETDLSVFAGAGIPGFDLAFIGGVEAYHTPHDNRGHLELASVQHQGSNALALARALDAERSLRGRGRAVYFDVLALTIVGWPETATLPLAGGTLLLALGAVAALVRRGRLDGRAVGAGVGVWLALSLATASLAFAAQLALAAVGALPFPWLAHPAPALLTALSLAVAATLTGVRLTQPLGTLALGVGHLLATAGLGLLASLLAPGTSYLFVVPAAAGALGMLLLALPRGRRATAAGWAPSLVTTAFLVGPIALSVYDALGLVSLALYSGLALWLLLPAAPALAQLRPGTLRRGALGALALALLALGAAAVVPSASQRVPRRTSLAYLREPDGKGRWLADRSWGPLPRSLARAAEFSGGDRPPPWTGSLLAAVQAPAPTLALAPPEVTLLSRSARDGGRRVRAHVRSRRAAPVIALVIPPGPAVTVWLAGERCEGRAHPSGTHYVHLTVPPEGFDLTVEADGAPRPALLVDATADLPAAAAALVAARDVDAIESHFGDATLAAVAVEL